MGAIEQAVIKGLVEVFVKQYTLSINTPLAKHIVNFMKKNRKDYDTSEKFMDVFDFMTHIPVIEYNGEKRIIQWDYPLIYDFHESGDRDYHIIQQLVDYFSGIEWKEDEDSDCYGTREYIGYIFRERIYKLKEFFNFTYDNQYNVYFDYEDEDDPNYPNQLVIHGDGWDYNAESIYRESEFYKNLKDKVLEYLKYEFVPYRKYNPEYTEEFIMSCEKEYDFNEKIEHLSKEQILNIIHQKPIGLVAKGCREENDTIIIDTGLTKEDLDNYKELDETTFKKFIKSILRQDDYKFRYIAERLYNV